MARHGGNTHNRGNLRKRGRRQQQQPSHGARRDATSQHAQDSQQQDALANQRELVERIAQAVSDQLGFAIGVETVGKRIRLTGTADSAAARADAEQTVAGIAPGMAIQNDLMVGQAAQPRADGTAYDDHDRRGDTRPPRATASLEAGTAAGTATGATAGTAGDGRGGQGTRDPGLAGQPLETNEIDVADDDMPDLDPPVEPDPTYFPPTDPVLGQDSGGGTEVIGGFSATSMADITVDRTTTGGTGDEALADAIRRELREDALTTDLPISVEVERGVARLRGAVPDLGDTTNAQEVAGRVPGVREVVDNLDIAPAP